MISNTLRDNVKQTVRETADIVEVIGECITLKKAGTRFVGLCPFHSEKTPSFSVNPQGQFFYCFGCGESGDVFSFVMKYYRMEFPEALKTLADKYHIALPEKDMSEGEKRRLREKDTLYRANESATVLYHRWLTQESWAAEARAYLQQRGVPEAFVSRYRLGFVPGPEDVGWSYQTETLRRQSLSAQALVAAGISVEKDRGGCYDRFRSRIMFPILDMTGRVVAFGGRIVGEGKPKYMNSPESPIFEKSRLLFGLYQHREAIRQARTAIVVEGNFDLLLLAVHGIDNVVAPLGTSLTRAHVKSLRGYCRDVVLLFDADTAGQRAAMRSIPLFLAEQVDCRIAVLPNGQDPDSLVREEGVKAVTQLVDGARPLAEFYFDVLVQEHGLTLSGKDRIMRELRSLLKEATDNAQRSLMVAHFSEKLGVEPGLLHAERPGRGQARGFVPPTQEGFVLLPRRERQLVEFVILYPEYLEQLLAAGMDKVLREGLSRRIVALLMELQEQARSTPEQLLTVLETEHERRYVAHLLMQGSGADQEKNAEVAAEMLGELLSWLEGRSDQEESLRLQQQIKEAEQKGDTGLLMQLLQKKMETEKKRTGY